jgi:transcriptional regulator with XRE-family HTH domain
MVELIISMHYACGVSWKQQIVQDLRLAVLKKKITQAEIAAALSISQSQVSRILGGKFYRKTRSLYALCKFFRVDVRPQSKFSWKNHQKLKAYLEILLDGTKHQEKAVINLLKSADHLSRRSPGH